MNKNPNKHAENQKLDRKTTKNILVRLLGYIMRYWPLFLLAIALTLISNQLSLLGPTYSGEAIDAIANENGVNFAAVKENVIKMLICYMLERATIR